MMTALHWALSAAHSVQGNRKLNGLQSEWGAVEVDIEIDTRVMLFRNRSRRLAYAFGLGRRGPQFLLGACFVRPHQAPCNAPD